MLRRLSTLLVLFMFPMTVLAAEPEMKVHFIDVGQGASTLLEFPTGAILIDTGGQGDDSSDRLARFLKSFFERRRDLNFRLNALIISHPHIDHTRGIKHVLNSCKVACYIDNGFVGTHTSGHAGVKFARDFAAQTRSMEIREILDTEIESLPDLTGLTDGQIDSISDDDCDPEIRILSGGLTSNPGWDHADFENQNNHSLVVRVDFGESSFLFTGDLQEAGIETLLEFYKSSNILDVDAFLVGHHGSHNATTPELLKAMSPKFAAIAMGQPTETHERYSAFAFGHPRRAIVEMLSKAIPNKRARPIDVKVADHVKDFTDFKVVKNIYATGWDGDITLTATRSGKFKVKTHTFRDPAATAVAIAPAATGFAAPEAPSARRDADGAYRWNLPIPEKVPSPTIANGKTVLFDVSHGGSAGQSDWVIDGGFSDFADALVKKGYTVREYRGVDKNGDGVVRFSDDRNPDQADQNEAVIQFDAIKDADVFVMSESNRPFRKDEQEALSQFVDSGKGLFFIADHYNADRNLNSWDATEVFNGYNRSTNQEFKYQDHYGDLRNPQEAADGWLAKNFGIRFRFNAINCLAGASDIVPAAESEQITTGVQPILMAAGCTLAIVDPELAKGIIYLKNNDPASSWPKAVEGARGGLYFGGRHEGPYVAISKPNKGKAAFIGDSSPIEDKSPKYREEIGGGTKSLHNGWNDPGNAARLSVNIVDWLATSEDYEGFDGTNGHSAGIATPDPLASQEMDDPADGQPWKPVPRDYNPWNPETFAPGAFGAPLPFGRPGPNPGPNPGPGPGPLPPGPPAGSALTVAKALATANGKTITVTGIVVAEFNDQFGLTLADSAGAQKVLVVQLPKEHRAQFSPKLKPSIRGKKVQITGKRGLYGQQPGLKDLTAIGLVSGP